MKIWKQRCFAKLQKTNKRMFSFPFTTKKHNTESHVKQYTLIIIVFYLHYQNRKFKQFLMSTQPKKIINEFVEVFFYK